MKDKLAIFFKIFYYNLIKKCYIGNKEVYFLWID